MSDCNCLFYMPADYGELECAAPTVSESSFPDAVIGEAWTGRVVFDGDYPMTFEIEGMPDWMTSTEWQRTVTFAGTPTAEDSGSVHLTVKATNCGGESSESFDVVFLVDCDVAQVVESSFPEAHPGSEWAGYVVYSGRAPIDVEVSGVPSWATETRSENRIDFAGTPSSTGTSTITITFTNCGGITSTQTYTVEVTCVAAAIATTSFPTATWGSAWSGYVTFSGTAPLTLAVTSVPSWVSYTIGDDRIDFSGTPGGSGVTGSNTIRFTYANCGTSTTSATYTFTVSSYNTSALYSSSGTFTVPDGVHWLMVTLVSGAPGSWTMAPIWVSKPSWLSTGCSSSTSVTSYTDLSDAAGTASTFGGIAGPAVHPRICLQEYETITIGSATYYSVFGTGGTGVIRFAMSMTTDSYYWSDDDVYKLCSSTLVWTFPVGSAGNVTLQVGVDTGATSSSGLTTKIPDSFGDSAGTSSASGAVQTETSKQSMTIGYSSASITYNNDAMFGYTCMPMFNYGWFKVNPGDKFSYTVGSAGKACYLGQSISTSTSSLSSSGNSKANAGGGGGKILVEWGSSFEDWSHDSYNTPTTASALAANAEPVPLIPAKAGGVTEIAGEISGKVTIVETPSES